MAWTASSSGCEQMFSQLKRSPAELACSRKETDRRLAIVVGSDPQFDSIVLEKAKQLYGRYLASGRARATVRQKRMDSGRPCVVQKAASKQAWARRRKEAVDRAAAQEDLCTPQRRPPAELPQSVAKEKAKQEDLLRKRKAEAYIEGTLLDKEVTEELKEEVARRLKVDGANDRLRARKYKDIAGQVAFREAPQTGAWALAQLPSPAYLVDRNAERLLRHAGVPTSCQDSSASHES